MLVGKNASGMYVIDEDYKIISYNLAAREIYPQLKRGEKCYHCLRNRETPCEICPVVNGIKGPKNYLEPGRNILRSVDAVEIPLESGGTGHALVFSDTKTNDEISSGMMENPLLMGIINVLGKNFINIYSVDRETHKVQVCRFQGQSGAYGEEGLRRDESYEKIMDIYIESSVAAEDRIRMHQMMDFEKICQRLTRIPQLMVHYRVRRSNGRIEYFYVKCARVGTAEDFQTVVFAFANEDMDVRYSEMEAILEPGGTASGRKLLIVVNDETDRKALTEHLEGSFEVITAMNEAEGMKRLSENYKTLSAILLDMSVPVCDEFQFLELIRDDVMLTSVPVIIITGSNRLEDEVRCLELGAVDFVRKPYNVRILKSKINNVIKLRESVMVLSALEYDDLTGLYIRQAFFHHAKTLMRFNTNQDFHVVVADIKNFKWINGTYGEKTGDQVLTYLGDTYRNQVRYGTVGRYGGDQFVAIIYGKKEIRMADMEKFIHRVESGAPIPNLVVNYGVYENVDKTLPFTLICDRAFLAMKSIRDDYEHQIAFYDDEMRQRHIRNGQMENAFVEAIRNEEFVVYLQPKYSVETEEIVGAEALVRWKRAEGTMVSPGEFIPLFEKDGLIVRLDEYVFRKVCSIQGERIRSGKKILPISVNLSRASIHYDNMICRYVKIVEENGIPFSSVPIELTETAALYNDRISKLIEKMVDAGFELHMDDFGSGYSSMTSLNQLPFDTLKLDKSLIDYIENFRGQQVIRHTISLAHSLGMKVLAEGVEKAKQVEILRSLSCDEVQGFYYARPLPWENFETKVIRAKEACKK